MKEVQKKIETIKKLGLPFVIILGIFYVCYSWTNAQKIQSNKALQIAKSVEASLPKDNLQKLNAQPEDLNKPEYQNLKKNLQAVMNVNHEARFAYIYTQKNGKIYFIADSEPITSKDYSPPGQEFSEANKIYFKPFNVEEAFFTNTVTDRWGKWRSALIPIKDPDTNKTIAVFAMDFDADIWNSPILYNLIESSVLAILAILLFLLYISIKRNSEILKSKQKELKKVDSKLKDKEDKFKEIFSNIEDIVYQTDLSGTILEISDSVSKYEGYSREKLLGTNILDLYSNPADRITLLNQIKTNGFIKDYELKFVTKNNPEAYISVNAKLMFDKNGNPSYINGAVRDVTERRKNKEKLIESEYLLRTIIETEPECIKIIDSEGKLILMNATGLDMIQADSFEQVNGAEVINLVAPRFRNDFTKLHKRVIQGNTSKLEFEIIGLKGRTKWLETLAVPMQLHGKTVHLAHTRDITDRKIAEQRLEKSEQFLKDAQKIGNIGAYDFDITTGYWISSETLDKIFGIDSDFEKNIEGWKKIMHPEWSETMVNYLSDIIDKKENFDKEYKIIKPNSREERWLRSLGKLQFDHLGKPIRLIGVIQDITTQKETEILLKKSESFLKKAQEIAHIGTYDFDIKSGIWTSSPILNEIYGIDENHNKTVPVQKTVVHPDWQQNVHDYMQNEVLGKKQDFDKQYKIIRINDKAERWVHTLGELQLDSDGEPIRLIGTVQDITRQKETEKELIRAKEKAEESERLKSAFLANMSHEIRTPMNGILGFTELLKEQNISGEKQTEYINIIRKSGNRMLNIINDIIDISKIESGLMKVTLAETNINEINEYIFNFFKHEALSEGIKISLKNGLPNEEAFIFSDKEKITNILTNLVKNAVKFTHKGKIEFGYRLKQIDENSVKPIDENVDHELEFYVNDTGNGIDQHQLQLIFERFRQTSESTSKDYEGAGLGLAITKSFVEMLGGKIWVESKSGVGSTFYFTLPYSKTAKKIKVKKQDTTIENNYSDLRILISEDDEISAKLLDLSVKSISNYVIRAKNGEEAVDLFKNNPGIDLILMDIQMPKMDGYQATAEIRKFNSDVIIIAQSAFALSEDVQKAKSVGFTDHIAKPVKKVELLKLIEKHFKEREVRKMN
ncbi:MAG: PAS domain S-box protein [Flavobacterium sp.]